MLSIIKDKLQPRVESKNEELVVDMITAVHDFANWLAPLGTVGA